MTTVKRHVFVALVLLLPVLALGIPLDAVTHAASVHHKHGRENGGGQNHSQADTVNTGDETAQQYDDSRCETHPVVWANDPCAGRQWGLTNIDAPTAWGHATGHGVTVAVVDTGVDFNHPDLAAQLIDVPGANMIENQDYACGDMSVSTYAGNYDAQDDHGHGTHVAGVIAAVTGNGQGVAGVAPEASILPVKVLDETGAGLFDNVARGICFAVDHGADVINLSLGVDPAESIAIEQGEGLADLDLSQIDQAVQYATDNGVAVIAAAGNEGFPICDYPAALPGVLCVGAVDQFDQKAWYSNFGAESSTNPTAINHVVAPGGAGTAIFCQASPEIWSTIWPGAGSDCFNDGYDTTAGTSAASPHVAGVAALIADRYGPAATPAFIYDKLKATADDLGASGVDLVYGHGRVNARRAVTE